MSWKKETLGPLLDRNKGKWQQALQGGKVNGDTLWRGNEGRRLCYRPRLRQAGVCRLAMGSGRQAVNFSLVSPLSVVPYAGAEDQMRTSKLIKGRVIYAAPDRLVLARGVRLFESKDGGDSWTLLTILPIGPILRVKSSISLLSRLTRSGVHHFEAGDKQSLVVADKLTFCFDGEVVKPLGELHGSRPMCLCSKNGVFYYGEYKINRERLPLHIWRWRAGQDAWLPVWTFSSVRHIHGVFHDPYTNALWVTTGDNDSEAAIWRTDDEFKTLRKVAGGSQQVRAVQLLFTSSHVYFGSDTPDEQNYIYRMDRCGNQLQRLSKVGGSVFYGCKVGECLFFSTAVEPSQTNYTRHAELWCSLDGSKWKKLSEFRKDIWSMRYFQYGQLLFPSGPGGAEHLYVYPFAVTNHGVTLKIEMSAILRQLAGIEVEY